MANTNSRIAGTAYLSADGKTYPVRGEFKYNPGTVKRESKTGMDGVHGYSEAPRVPFISCAMTDTGDMSVAAINAMNNVTVVVELANGKTIIGRNMWTVDDQDVDSVEAQFDVKWEGVQGSVTEN
jgi:hypothetical protein